MMNAYLRIFGVCCLLLLTPGCASDDDGNRSDPASWKEYELPESSCEWNSLASSAIPRLESYPVLLGNKLYAVTGFTSGLRVSPQVEIYDFGSGKWSSGTAMPVAVTHMGVALVDSDIWVVGGFEGNHPGVATNAVQIYDTKTDQWREGPALPFPRASGSMVYANGKLHHFGGLLPDRRTNVDEHWVLNLGDVGAGWKQKASLPEARNHLGGVALNGNIYAVGGQFGHDGPHRDVRLVHVYNTQNDEWQRLADIPATLSHIEAGIFSFENRIYVAGGETDSGAAQTLFVYDPKTDAWSEFCSLPESLLAPGARVYQGRLYLLNGGVGGACCPVSDFRYIDLINK